MRWLAAILILLGCGNGSLFGATLAETKAFKTATYLFEDKIYSIAEKSFGEFLAKYPNSEHRPEAVLFQARARFQQSNYAGAMQLLQGNLPQAGRLADQYYFWLGRSLQESGKPQEATENFSQLIKNFPQSSLHAEACYFQALIFSRRNDWAQIIDLLSRPDGDFQKSVPVKPNDPFVLQGLLLLSEAFFNQKKFAESEKVLVSLNERALPPELKWRQQYLLCRVQMEQQHFEAALDTSSNLVRTTAPLSQPRVAAESINLQAGILEKLNRLPEAIEVYEQNLSTNLPHEFRRQALYKTVDLMLTQNKAGEAISRLEKFVAQHTNDTTLDLALFTLGELQLKRFFAAAENVETNLASLDRTNLLDTALTNFSTVITNFSNSELLGKCYLNRGWCHWIGERFEEAQRDFAEAVARLPVSEEQAIARFKLADTQFRLQDYAGAAAHYDAVARNYGNLPAIQSTLVDQALYQLVRASLRKADEAAAQEAMRKILVSYPNTGFAERSMLLVGQDLNRKGSAAEARALYEEFVRKAPNSSLAPKVKLEIARTFVRERKWARALAAFDEWISTFEDHPLLADAEFSRATATSLSGNETNAFMLFTNFVAQFPSNNLTALAENWLGDFYYNREEFPSAEIHYQLVSSYNPPLELACESRLAAARAAYARQGTGFKNAREMYLLPLINDTNTPPSFAAEAWYALGDVIFGQYLAYTNDNDFREALAAFSVVTNKYSTNILAPLALGRLGECHLQAALKDPTAYVVASNAFAQVLESPLADKSTRAKAEVLLGVVSEALGQPEEAWTHYAKVLYVDEGDDFDPRWVKEAGLAAAKLCESREQWKQAVNVYRRLLSVVPSLKPTLEKKIASAGSRLQSAPKPGL